MCAERHIAENLRKFRCLAESLRDGQTPELLRTKFAPLVSNVRITDAAPVFLELVSEGHPRENVRLLIESYLDSPAAPIGSVLTLGVTLGHPVEMFQRENEALRSWIDRCRNAMRRVHDSPDAYRRVEIALNQLADVDSHYRRQEFLLFARLEHHEFVRPGRILWAAHDEIRQWLKYLGLQFASDDFNADTLAAIGDSVVEPLLDDLEWMIFLEESLLLLLVCDVLDTADWDVIWRHSPKIGWCLVEPHSKYPSGQVSEDDTRTVGDLNASLPTGTLSPELLVLLHHQLPIDLTFVDAEDRVQYFSEGTRPVFYRSEAILGREVRCCHPPRSVHYVDQILTDFKSGRETSAQFWKHLGDRFIHIRFVALRNETGDYLGTVEIAQDITHLQALEGQRLELCYD